MSKKNRAGSRKKSSTDKYRKRRKKELENRAFRQEEAIKQDAERIHAEAEFSERNFTLRDAPSVCPLCNQPITEEDMKGNVHQVIVDHKRVQVHRTCPGEPNE